MKLDQIHNVYFLGIGGIGMSALARWFKHNGKNVSGYDRTETALTKQLQAEGFDIHFEENLNLIDDKVKEDKERTLVVYTPAIPKNHGEWMWFQLQGYTIMKRSQVLGVITQNMKSVAVAGTHGKTTTTSMIVHLLKSCGIDCTGFLGGISANYNTNMVLNENKDSIAVIEADEFDRSFLTLHPNIAVVTATDADHLDIYGDKSHLEESFRLFVKQIKENGKLFVKNEIAKGVVTDATLDVSLYGFKGEGISAKNFRIEDASFVFDYQNGATNIEGIRLNVPGYHNVENMLAAISVTELLGGDGEAIKTAVSSYRGVKRRFEYIIKTDALTFIDDYAHHPVEIEALLKSVRDLYPNKKITAIFQPHLFSRTRDFAAEFAESLSLADELIMLDIYPARELPMEGVTSEIILKDVKLEQKQIVAKEALVDTVLASKPEVLLTIGAGDIDKMVQPLKESLL
ncbi:UDP-N-acetylmuramate--L-alanine ligase [Roseivirga pacifica]|uniref:UDP-N-acetylmuramate--L-alanine ligase n=1 Tax=Roseivirga pacifica TaxID=1267423 RepID=UPI00227AD88A|nr:UDP-N-acetylmuramate--L-alanine ligase [Roseivirga pacifica]